MRKVVKILVAMLLASLLLTSVAGSAMAFSITPTACWGNNGDTSCIMAE